MEYVGDEWCVLVLGSGNSGRVSGLVWCVIVRVFGRARVGP